MVSALVYSRDREEIKRIHGAITNLAAILTEEKWEIFPFFSLKELSLFLTERPLINMACYDITHMKSLAFLEGVRKHYSDMLLMLVADDSVSPMDYVKPGILASSLILRPYTADLLREKLKDMICRFLISLEDADVEDAFVVETREGRTRIPYYQIFYLEARDKKIYLRLQNREFSFNGTLDELEEQLFGRFLRCHRSFLINQMHLEQIHLSKNEILLSHGISVPLSRSYKPRFKAFR